MTLSRFSAGAALAALAVFALLPYFALLALGPVALDSAEWIARGASSDPNWKQWVFGTQHFGVGYRPVTALSFALTERLVGLEPAVYRLTDLVLHTLGGLLVYHLYCALAHRDAARRIGGLIAAAVFLLHPAAQDVLPILARRSYLLAAVFGVAGLLVLARSLAKPGRPTPRLAAGLASGALLALALFSNESGAVAIAAVPAVAAVSLGTLRWRPIFAASSASLAVAGFAVALRLSLLGGTGGYGIGASLASRLVPVFAAAWRSVAGGSPGSTPWPLALLVALVLALVLVWALWQIVQAVRRGPATQDGIYLLGAGWLVATTLLYASQGVWYPRQAYLLLAPLALVVAALCSPGPTPRSPAALGRLPGFALCAILLSASPALRGLDAAEFERLARLDAQRVALERGLDPVRSPALVRLVVPYEIDSRPPNPLRADPAAAGDALHRDSFAAAVWLNALQHGKEIEVRDFVFYEALGENSNAPALVSAGGGRNSLQLTSRGYRVGTATGQPGVLPVAPGARVEVGRIARPGVREYLLVLDANGARLEPL